MALTQSKIRAIGYDSKSIQDDTIVDGTNFSGVGPFLLIANRAIPKDSKVYMEFVVTTPYPTNKDIRHIPLCLGVHKEPSFGVLGSDCSLGAIYYTKNAYLLGPTDASYLAFCIRDKYAGQLMTYRYIKQTTGRVPIRGTVIGLGVDMANNLISLYADGSLFYSFNPSSFHMNEDEAEFYLAAYCAEPGEALSGTINFGRYRCKYIPDGYFDMYQELYDKIEAGVDIASQVNVGNQYDYMLNKDIISGSFGVTNKIAPIVNHRRDLKLITNHEGLEFYKDDDKIVVNEHAFVYRSNADTQDDPDMAYIDLPIDHHKRIYFEFYSSGATIIDDHLGIPLTIGITSDPTNLSLKTFEIDLFHLRTDGYHLRTIKDGFEFLAGNYDIRNPSSPVQPNVIGVIVDLEKNAVELYTEGILFTIVYPNSDLVDFSKSEECVYFFFLSQPSKFEGEGYVVCNLGTKSQSEMGNGEDLEELKGYLDDNFKWPLLVDETYILSYWWYYNLPLQYYFYNDIHCTMKVISDHIPYSKYIFSTITVKEPESSEWGPGLNRLYSTYNRVSNDEEKKNQPNRSIFDVRNQMELDKDSNKR